MSSTIFNRFPKFKFFTIFWVKINLVFDRLSRNNVHHISETIHRTIIKFCMQLLCNNIWKIFKRFFEIPIFRHLLGFLKTLSLCSFQLKQGTSYLGNHSSYAYKICYSSSLTQYLEVFLKIFWNSLFSQFLEIF